MREEFEDQLTHTLLVIRFKLQELHGWMEQIIAASTLISGCPAGACTISFTNVPRGSEEDACNVQPPIEISVITPPTAGWSRISDAEKFARSRRYSRRSNSWEVCRLPGRRA